jgi:hypothetical protein
MFPSHDRGEEIDSPGTGIAIMAEQALKNMQMKGSGLSVNINNNTIPNQKCTIKNVELYYDFA